MIEQILMGASAVITLSTAYVAWHYANKVQYLRELLAEARSERNEYAEDFDNAVVDNVYKASEIDRLSDLVAKYQAKNPIRTSEGKFASKRAAKTAELREYVASKKEAVS